MTETKTEVVRLRITRQFKEQLAAAAKADNRTMSSYIEQALKKQFERAQEDCTMKITKAKDLPIYSRAIARYPHLAEVMDAKTFCINLCRLAAVETITPVEYWAIGAVANGMEWLDEKPWEAARLENS